MGGGWKLFPFMYFQSKLKLHRLTSDARSSGTAGATEKCRISLEPSWNALHFFFYEYILYLCRIIVYSQFSEPTRHSRLACISSKFLVTVHRSWISPNVCQHIWIESNFIWNNENYNSVIIFWPNEDRLREILTFFMYRW